MTIANENSLVTHTGNGVTTEWPYTFIIPDEDFARVGLFEIASSTLTLIDAADYSISGIDDPAGGEVIYPLVGDPIESTHRLVIWRELPYHQDTQLTNQTPYYSVVLEAQLDRIVMQIQQLAEETGRAVKVTQGSTSTPDELLEDISDAVTAAGNSASAAAGSAGTATTKAGEADASATLAEEWASADEDVLVAATDYSAKHYSIKSSDSAAAALASENAVALASVPVGMVFFSPKGTVPAGYLALEGASFDETVYTELYAYLGTNVLPDYTDRVLRHAGPLAGAVFTTQEDAMQRITGAVDNNWPGTNVEGAFSATPGISNRPGNGGSSSSDLTFDSGNSPGARVSDDETRVKAAIGKFVIKAYAALVDGGTADLVAIEAAQQYMVRFDAQVLTTLQQQQAMLNLGVPITKEYVSAEQTITNGSGITLTHALGVAPKAVQVVVRCKTAELGYSVGDEVVLATQADVNNSGQIRGVAIASNVTNLWVGTVALGFGAFVRRDTFVLGDITPSNWRYVVRAWA